MNNVVGEDKKDEKVFKDLNENNENNKLSYNILTVPEYAIIPSRVVMFINAVSPEFSR